MTDFITKDSGEREGFGTGSVRDTQDGKPRFDLIPPGPYRRLAMLYARGAEKYGDSNWQLGQPTSRTIASLERHVQDWKGGDKVEDHMAAVAWNALNIMFYEGSEWDDYQTPVAPPRPQAEPTTGGPYVHTFRLDGDAWRSEDVGADEDYVTRLDFVADGPGPAEWLGEDVGADDDREFLGSEPDPQYEDVFVPDSAYDDPDTATLTILEATQEYLSRMDKGLYGRAYSLNEPASVIKAAAQIVEAVEAVNRIRYGA